MTDAVREKAAQSQGLVEEVNATVLPEPSDANAIVPLAKADATQSAEIQKRMAEATDEMSHYFDYDYVLINRHLEDSLYKLRTIFLF